MSHFGREGDSMDALPIQGNLDCPACLSELFFGFRCEGSGQSWHML
jgi:hypothetical protein